jgi:hypothetical protein
LFCASYHFSKSLTIKLPSIDKLSRSIVQLLKE